MVIQDLIWGKPIEVSLGMVGAQERVPLNHVDFHPRDSNVLVVAGNALAAIYVLKYVQPQLLLKPELDGRPPPTINRWLHSEPINPIWRLERVSTIREHSSYLVKVAWSPSGELLASCDAQQLNIWSCDTEWQTTVLHNITEPECGEFFDFCWVDDSTIAVGGTRKIKLVDVHRRLEKMLFTLDIPEGTICKGLSTTTIPNTTEAIFVVSTNDKRNSIYKLDLNNLAVCPSALLDLVNPDLFADGPADVPLLRSPSIDCTGRLIAFPYGQRRSQFFGVLIDLQEKMHARCLPDPMRAHEVSRDAEYRFRGHQGRVNCAAFSNRYNSFPIRATEVISNTKFVSSRVKEMLMHTIEDQMVAKQATWPYVLTYAQSSVDGCLSIWLVTISQNGNGISAQCVLTTPNSIVDQTGMITDLSWSCNDSMLAIASDDGKLTLVGFYWRQGEAAALRNSSLMNVTPECKRPNFDPRYVKQIPIAVQTTLNANTGDITSPVVLVTPN